MLEFEIKGVNYQFHFGMGFLREVNKMVTMPVEGIRDVRKEVGLRYTIARVIDGEVDALVDVLNIANKSQTPRLTKKAIEDWIEDEETDIDSVFEMVIDFLSKANVTKKTTVALLEVVEEQKRQNQQKQ